MMGIYERLLSFYKREEPQEDKRGKVCLANGLLYSIEHTPHLRVRDVCIEIAKKLDIAPVALDFFTLMTTDCEHCLRPNRQVKQKCDKSGDHYLNPKRILHAEECDTKVFFFRLAFKAIPGPDLKMVNKGAYVYFIQQCRWDYINGRINDLSRKDHMTLLILEAIMRAKEENVSSKEVLDNPKRFGIAHLFMDDEVSQRDMKTHLKRELSNFKKCQESPDKAANSFLCVLEGVADFGVTKICAQKFYYQNGSDKLYPVEWEILISANGVKKRRTYKDEREFDGEGRYAGCRKEEIISDYKDIEYLEIKQSESAEIIHISRQQGFLEVISVGKSMIKKESLITLIEGYYHILVNQYKTLTKYEPGLELPIATTQTNTKLPIHGPIERKKAESLLKAVETESGDRSGVHMIRRSRQKFDSFVLSFICGCEVRHYEIEFTNVGKYGIVNGPKFDSLTVLLECYKIPQERFPTALTKYCPIPRQGLCALFDEHIVVEPPRPPSTSRPTNPEYGFENIGNLQLEKLHHTFTNGDFGGRVFKARWLRGDGGYQEVFCRRLESPRSANFKDKIIEFGENMASLVHRNLVQFYGVCFYDEQSTYLAFEWISSGTLDDYLKKEADVTVEKILTFAAQVAEACMFLHDKNYVHGWLAAHNVLVVSDESVKLSDVSVPCLREKEILNETTNINRSPWKARECFQGRRYSKESDVWAFAVVLWEMFMKTIPFQNMTDDMILQVFQQERHLACPKWCPEEVRRIMKSCWITEPSRRPLFANIVVKLRQIIAKLSPEERLRKIPETIDEKFIIEPLIPNKPTTVVLGESCSSLIPSGGSFESSDGERIDSTCSEESYASSTTEDSLLDLIPEKECSHMLWTPEEIELKKIKGKSPRPLTTEKCVDVTYDRIGQTESCVDTNVESVLLKTAFPRNVGGEESVVSEVILNEVVVAEGDPGGSRYEAVEDRPVLFEQLLGSAIESGLVKDRPNVEIVESEARDYNRLVGDNTVATEEFVGEEENEGELLVTQTNAYPHQVETNFPCLEEVCPSDLLASLIESHDLEMTRECKINSDLKTAERSSVDTSCEGEVSFLLSDSLDPFAPDSEDRASVMLAGLSSSMPQNSVNCSDVDRCIPNSRLAGNVLAPRYPSQSSNQSLDYNTGRQFQNSPYMKAGTKSFRLGEPSPTFVKKAGSTSYQPAPSAFTTSAKARQKQSPSTPGSSNLPFSRIRDLSILDPFQGLGNGSLLYSAQPSCEPVLSGGNETTSCPPTSSAYQFSQLRQLLAHSLGRPASLSSPNLDRPRERSPESVHPLDIGSFSSFSDRDPMSEVLTSGINDAPSSMISQFYPKGSKVKHEESRNSCKPSNHYVSSSLSTSRYSRNGQKNTINGSSSRSLSTASTKLTQPSEQALKHSLNRSGYVAVSPGGQRVISSLAEKESRGSIRYPTSASTSCNTPSRDRASRENDKSASSFLNFSKRDPLMEAIADINEGIGASRSSPKEIAQNPTGNVGYQVANRPNVLPSGLEMTGLASTSLDGTSMTRPAHLSTSSAVSHVRNARSAVRPQAVKSSSSESQGVWSNPRLSNPRGTFGPPSATKLSLENLASKLATSRQSTSKSATTSNPTNISSKALKDPSIKSTPTVLKAKKPMGYVAFPSAHDRGNIKNANLPAVNHLNNSPSNFETLSHGQHLHKNPYDASRGVKLSTNAEYNRSPTADTSRRKGISLTNYVQSRVSPPKDNQGNISEGLNKSIADENSFPFTTLSGTLGVGESVKAHFESPDIPQLSQTSLEDMFSTVTSDLRMRNVDDSLSRGETPHVRANEGTPAVTSSVPETNLLARVTLAEKETVEFLAVDESNVEHDDHELSFSDRNPLVELLNFSSDQESNVTEKRLEKENEQLTSNGKDNQLVYSSNPACKKESNFTDKSVVVTSYPTAQIPLRSSAQETSTPPQNQAASDPRRAREQIPSTNSLGGTNGEGSSPDTDKPRSSRKMSGLDNGYAKISIVQARVSGVKDTDEPRSSRKKSELDNGYAKVSIVQARVSGVKDETSGEAEHEETLVGAVGGSEPSSELPEQDAVFEQEPEGDEKTVVDPFNITDAAESIQNLEPYRYPPRVPITVGATETFEESMRTHLIPFASLSFNVREPDLGRGAFGVVRKAKLTRTGNHRTRSTTEVAVKCLRDGASEIYKNSFKQEAINLMKLDNKFIVRFLGISYNEEKNLLLVTELVPQGSLDKYLRDPKNMKILGNEVLLQFAIQITMGMQYLESKKLVHRDLAARNILVASESQVKISDFGLSRIYDDEYYRSHRENQKLPIRWLAPECLELKKFTVNSDVWSLGVTLWEMFSYGKRPYDDFKFQNTSELIEYVKKGNRLQKPPACPDDIYSHIQECWNLNPVRRISFFLLKMLLEETLKDKYAKKPYFM